MYFRPTCPLLSVNRVEQAPYIAFPGEVGCTFVVDVIRHQQQSLTQHPLLGYWGVPFKLSLVLHVKEGQ